MRLADKISLVLIAFLIGYASWNSWSFSKYKEKVAMDSKKTKIVLINSELKTFKESQEAKIVFLYDRISKNEKAILLLKSEIVSLEKDIEKDKIKTRRLYEKRNSIHLNPDSLPRF